MKKVTVLLGLVIVLSFFFLPKGVVFAQQNNNPVIVSKDQTIKTDYLAKGTTIIIDGSINGDAYLAGGTIVVDGTVVKDILAVGGNITIRGTARNIRVAGGNITLDGTVLENVSVLGGNITIGPAAHIHGSIVGVGGQMSVLGPIDKNLTFGGGNVTLTNTIGGNASVAASRLTLSPQSSIEGTLHYISQNNATIPQGAVISGSVSHQYPPKMSQQPNQTALGLFVGLFVYWKIASFLLSLLIGMLFFQFMPHYTQRVVEKVREKTWLSFGIGFLTLIITPIALIILALTLVGIPLVFVWIISLFAFFYVGRLIVLYVVGFWVIGKVQKKFQQPIIALFVGLLLFALVGVIPLIGGLVQFVTNMIGLGALVLMEKEFYTELRSKKII